MPKGRAARRKGSPRPPVQIALIQWTDASYQDGPDTADNLLGTVTLTTGGLLVKDTPDDITIAIDRCEAKRTWRHIVCIPKTCILWVKTAWV